MIKAKTSHIVREWCVTGNRSCTLEHGIDVWLPSMAEPGPSAPLALRSPEKLWAYRDKRRSAPSGEPPTWLPTPRGSRRFEEFELLSVAQSVTRKQTTIYCIILHFRYAEAHIRAARYTAVYTSDYVHHTTA